MAMITVFMTAFYTFRAVFLTFEGEYKGGEPPQHGEAGSAHETGHRAPHESPLVMALPLLILAVPAALAGFVNFPNHATEGLAHLLEGALPAGVGEDVRHDNFSVLLAASSTALALLGIALAYVVYQAKAIDVRDLRRIWGPVATLVERKYYMDDLYEQVVVRNAMYRGVWAAAQWFDEHVIDFAVNGSGRATRRAGDLLRWVQTGSFQAYGSVGFAGLVVAMFLMLVLIER
jgi:NADH-quinone oxidoreductase subunit L